MYIYDMKKLCLDGGINLISQMVDDYLSYVENADAMPDKKTFNVVSSDESYEVSSSARLKAYSSILKTNTLTKLAFDTRRIDQKFDKNPRTNLQYYNRSEQFIDKIKHNRMVTIGKLIEPLNDIQKDFGDQPEYFQSYAMTLHDLVTRALRIKQEDLEVFSPQLDYLEQLLYARYRLSLEDINKFSHEKIRERILAKDEALLKRGNYLHNTDVGDVNKQSSLQLKDGNKPSAEVQESIINAIFGNNSFRRSGEKKVQRTITITLKDEVIDE